MFKDVFFVKENVSTPVYSQIAIDIASRIVSGDLKEDSKIYGRSMMASEYGVSPETIRRALKLLSDMDIVDIRQNSGTIILSSEKAKEYIARFNVNEDIRSRYQKMKKLIKEEEELNQGILEIAKDIIGANEKFSRTNPFQNYEVPIKADSPVIGKTIGDLKFWQETGATVIAIRRAGKIILSPGPYASLHQGDILVFVGGFSVLSIVEKFIEKK